MEQMVIGAVRGAPITSKPRTDHFKIRSRAQTPGPGHQSESSDSYHDEAFSGSGTDTSGGTSTSREDKELDSFNDSDSSAEMALISQAFKEPKSFVPVTGTAPVIDPTNEGFESAGHSSLDATLSEIRILTTSTEPPIAKCRKGRNGGTLGAFPWRRNFSPKLAGHAPSFLVLQIPSTILTWCGATYVRKTYLKRQRAHWKSYAIIEPRITFDETKDGAMSTWKASTLWLVTQSQGAQWQDPHKDRAGQGTAKLQELWTGRHWRALPVLWRLRESYVFYSRHPRVEGQDPDSPHWRLRPTPGQSRSASKVVVTSWLPDQLPVQLLWLRLGRR